MAKKLALKSFRLKNFKAIQDSGVVKFTPLTVLIGDNGSGKSSLIEGLQTYQRVISHGLNEAMQIWRGFEHITNPPLDLLQMPDDRSQTINPIEFALRGHAGSSSYRIEMKVNMSSNGNDVYIETEKLWRGNRKFLSRNQKGEVFAFDETESEFVVDSGLSIIGPWLMVINPVYKHQVESPRDAFDESLRGFDWQFVFLKAQSMGDQQPLERSGRDIKLRSDGLNIAEYLLDIRRQSIDAYDGIIETLQYVLPYLNELEPTVTTELERAVYLRMQEDDYKIPGWLLSTGSLRILALLALFRHPNPPSVIIIEELENGLDPRSVQLIVEEIRRVTDSGRSQVIVTSHSPYLLDLFDLSHIVLVERNGRSPTFTRPDERQELDGWKERFGPGTPTCFWQTTNSGLGMKVGMIFECGDQGADIEVCVHLAKRIRPNLSIETDALGNKRDLLDCCGVSAAQLLRVGCLKVFIIWDLYPSFKQNKAPCRHDDKESIYSSLEKACVSTEQVELICIEAELESWLVADYRAVRDVLWRRNPRAKTRRLRQAKRSKDPKGDLSRLFEAQIKSPYQPHVHAIQIVEALPNLDRLRKVDSFQRFESKLST